LYFKPRALCDAGMFMGIFSLFVLKVNLLILFNSRIAADVDAVDVSNFEALGGRLVIELPR
jgi:hypothetical protein